MYKTANINTNTLNILKTPINILKNVKIKPIIAYKLKNSFLLVLFI